MELSTPYTIILLYTHKKRMALYKVQLEGSKQKKVCAYGSLWKKNSFQGQKKFSGGDNAWPLGKDLVIIFRLLWKTHPKKSYTKLLLSKSGGLNNNKNLVAILWPYMDWDLFPPINSKEVLPVIKDTDIHTDKAQHWSHNLNMKTILHSVWKPL